jgi:hypothetical protein
MIMVLCGHCQLISHLLMVLLAYANLASETVYFITSLQNTSCPQQPCLTLSQMLTTPLGTAPMFHFSSYQEITALMANSHLQI